MNADTTHHGDGAPEPAPVDTLRAPHEPVVVTPSSVRVWRHVLAGPVVWIVHFATVYLVAEATCEAERTGRFDVFDSTELRIFVIAATVIGVVLTVVAAAVTARAAQRRDGSPLLWSGVLLSIGSAASVVAVGGVVLWIGPC